MVVVQLLLVIAGLGRVCKGGAGLWVSLFLFLALESAAFWGWGAG